MILKLNNIKKKNILKLLVQKFFNINNLNKFSGLKKSLRLI